MAVDVGQETTDYQQVTDPEEAARQQSIERAKQELERVLELVPPLHISSVVARNRKDFDSRGKRLPSGALIIDCVVEGGVRPREHRVTIDDTTRTLSEPTITFLGAEAISRQTREGDYIYHTVSAASSS